MSPGGKSTHQVIFSLWAGRPRAAEDRAFAMWPANIGCDGHPPAGAEATAAQTFNAVGHSMGPCRLIEITGLGTMSIDTRVAAGLPARPQSPVDSRTACSTTRAPFDAHTIK